MSEIKDNVIKEEIDTSSIHNNFLYPHTNDPNFSLKISHKKEFSENKQSYIESKNEKEFKETSEKLINGRMMFSPHQLFIRNFLSSSTPYNSLLLFHGLGSGKTLTSIGVAEQYREDMKNTNNFKPILVVASPNVQENFQLQLFDKRNLTFEGGLWRYNGTANNSFLKQLNPMGLKNLYSGTEEEKDKLVTKIKSIIKQNYVFMGYRKFSTYIQSLEERSSVGGKIRMSIFVKLINLEFDDRMIIIDEIHNIKKIEGTTASADKKVVKSILSVIKNSNNMRLLLLSATPMYNDYKEIVWLLNMLNLNDGKKEIYVKDIFDKDGNINDDGRIKLIEKSRGYVSFVKGENPYTFPYRIFPSLHSPNNSILNSKKFTYPKRQMNGAFLVEENTKIQHLDLYVTNMGEFQKEGYRRVREENLDKIKQVVKPDNETRDARYNYTIMQPLIECLNFVFPDPKREDGDLRTVLHGNNAMRSLMNFEKSVDQHYKKNYDYKPETIQKLGRVFSYEEIGKYSGKAKDIIDKIWNSEGVSIIYSQYIDSGIIPMALTLEERGFARYGETPSLFDPDYIKRNKIKPVDYNCEEKKPGSKKFVQAKYAVISGDNLLSPNNKVELISATNESNKNGEDIKVIFITKAGSESLDFKFIRNIFVMDPWYNLSRIEQIIGRGVRFKSHRLLDFENRNVSIYLYCSNPLEDNNETADMYIYRRAEKKSIQIGKVTRILKESSVDCVLNESQNLYTKENMSLKIKQKISNGNVIDYEVGDKPFSPNCDYMDTCVYKCQNIYDLQKGKLEISSDTFNEKLSVINMEVIMGIVKELFSKQYIYEKDNLVKDIQEIRNFLIEEIDIALENIVNDNMFIVKDHFGRPGYIVNVGEYYLYQPEEIQDKSISIFERSTPLDYKMSHIKIKADTKKINRSVKEIEDFENKYNRIIQYCQKPASDFYKDPKTKKCIIDDDEIVDGKYEYLGYNIIMKFIDNVDPSILNSCIIEYLFDRTNINEKQKILENIDQLKKNTDEYSKHLYQYLLIHQIEKMEEGKKNNYFIFEHQHDYVVFEKDKENSWKQNSTLKKYLENDIRTKKEITINKISDFIDEYIGLMLQIGSKKSSKDMRIDFKMKYMKNKKGRSFSGIDHNKNLKIELINEYLYGNKVGDILCNDGKRKIICDTITKYEEYYNFCGESSPMRIKSITVLMELTFRYYDKVKYKGKRWFLDPIESLMTEKSKTILL